MSDMLLLDAVLGALDAWLLCLCALCMLGAHFGAAGLHAAPGSSKIVASHPAALYWNAWGMFEAVLCPSQGAMKCRQGQGSAQPSI